MQTEAPPQQVLTIPSEGEAYFADHPVMLVDGKKYLIFAFVVTGSSVELYQALEKLTADGWPGKLIKGSHGRESLSVPAKGKAATSTLRISEKIRAGDYGPVEATPFVMSVPESMK